MLMVTAAPSRITFSYAAAFRGDGYEGKSKPTISLTQTLMLRHVCLQHADQHCAVFVSLYPLTGADKSLYEYVCTPE